MLRYDFQEVCCMTRTTANRHLRRLLEEGKLRNIGKRMQPIYVAAAGYYGVSRDAPAVSGNDLSKRRFEVCR